MRDFLAGPAVAHLARGSCGGAPSLAPRLSEVEPETDDGRVETAFGRSERLRTLGLALASLVSPTIGR